MITPIVTLRTGIAAIPSVEPGSSLSAPPRAAAVSSTIDGFSSIVDLSETGRLLSAASAPTPAATGTASLPVPTGPLVAPADRSISPAVMAAEVDALAAERQAAAATLALQNLLANPAMRATDIFFDPAYSALIAAARLSDFVPRTPVTDSKMLEADFPAPVVPAAWVRPVEGRI